MPYIQSYILECVLQKNTSIYAMINMTEYHIIDSKMDGLN